jgi:acid phosphatase type 7
MSLRSPFLWLPRLIVSSLLLVGCDSSSPTPRDAGALLGPCSEAGTGECDARQDGKTGEPTHIAPIADGPSDLTEPWTPTDDAQNDDLVNIVTQEDSAVPVADGVKDAVMVKAEAPSDTGNASPADGVVVPDAKAQPDLPGPDLPRPGPDLPRPGPDLPGPDEIVRPETHPDLPPSPDLASPPEHASETFVTLAIGGDPAEQDRTSLSRDVADLISSHDPPVTGLFLTGDTARYLGSGTLFDFIKKYYESPGESNFGQFGNIVFPQLGNHEYLEHDARGYFDYFATRMQVIAALPSYHGSIDTVGQGWYSVDVNGWHVISLNSNCDEISGGCSTGGTQDDWLADDLAGHAGMPTLALWHAPRWTCTTDGHAAASDMQGLWARLYDAHVDFVFNGHNHLYQRYKPIGKSSSGSEDAQGITEVIVGTYGSSTYKPCSAGSDPRVAKTVGGDGSLGSFFLTLGSDGSYSWEFRLLGDGSVFDAGAGTSHNRH